MGRPLPLCFSETNSPGELCLKKKNKDKIKNISLGAPYCMHFQLHVRSLRILQVSVRLVAQAG